ncbi:MAG: M67 family metallopeptidase [Bacteroidota bacterium]
MKIAEELMQNMKAHAEKTYPEECCGVFLGEERDGQVRVLETFEIDNRQDLNRQRRFLVTPEQYRHAEQVADAHHLTLLGFYHSHPDHPAIPSAFDTDHALPWFTYVIVNVSKGKAGEVTAWVLRDNREEFDACPLAVVTVSDNVASRP